MALTVSDSDLILVQHAPSCSHEAEYRHCTLSYTSPFLTLSLYAILKLNSFPLLLFRTISLLCLTYRTRSHRTSLPIGAEGDPDAEEREREEELLRCRAEEEVSQLSPAISTPVDYFVLV